MWAEQAGEVLGVIVGVIPREEITGDPSLGHDLLEIEIEKAGSSEAAAAEAAAEEEVAAMGALSELAALEAAAEDEDEEREVAEAWEAGEPDTVLVPYVEQIVVGVRLEEGFVLLDPPAGLFDLVQPKKMARVVIRGLLPQFAESLRRAQ